MRSFRNLGRRTKVRVPSAVTDLQQTVASSAPTAPEPAVALPLPRTVVPLQSLTQYQYDPAFALFQQKLHRPPGTTRSRTRLRPDDYPPRQPQSRPSPG